MADERLFCAKFKLPALEQCLQFSEWAVIWQAAGIILGLIGATFAAFKFYKELKNLRQQRDIETSLKRTEFFLSQHRRLFDDEELSSVLNHLDDDNQVLAKKEFWDRNRKFLTFIEEIQLLINSNKLEPSASYYMFGYYARCARDGKNFNRGINASVEHWRLFNDFCTKSDEYFKANPKGPDNGLQL